ncbi:MAG TPA: hypothetical protein VD767_07425, partial [Thermomicrobiales bacterium]|nr:hypothetical protein [Thermomicrobiales bacterium]
LACQAHTGWRARFMYAGRRNPVSREALPVSSPRTHDAQDDDAVGFVPAEDVVVLEVVDTNTAGLP